MATVATDSAFTSVKRGASAGSRTRINGFGGHYTIHCATLANKAWPRMKRGPLASVKPASEKFPYAFASSRQKQQPFPASDCTQIRPFMRSMARRAIASPTPLPGYRL